MNHHQQFLIEYLEEEIRLLKKQLGKRPRVIDHQRRRLAVKGKPVGRKNLLLSVNLLTPDTPFQLRQILVNKIDFLHELTVQT